MDWIYLVTVLGVILVSMTLHEVAHAFAGYFLGDNTAKLQGRLTLNPIKHIDPVLTILLPMLLAITGAPVFGGAKPVPFNPNNVKYGEWGVALVALAGPLTNFVLAFLSFGLMVLSGGEGVIGNISQISLMVNLGFCIFNLIPIPPLDGSRVLYALAPDSFRRIMERIEQYGVVVVFVLVMVGSPIIGKIMLFCIKNIIGLFTIIYGV